MLESMFGLYPFGYVFEGMEVELGLIFLLFEGVEAAAVPVSGCLVEHLPINRLSGGHGFLKRAVRDYTLARVDRLVTGQPFQIFPVPVPGVSYVVGKDDATLAVHDQGGVGERGCYWIRRPTLGHVYLLKRVMKWNANLLQSGSLRRPCKITHNSINQKCCPVAILQGPYTLTPEFDWTTMGGIYGMSSQGPEADFLPPSETGSMDGSGGGGIGGIVGITTASEVLREVFGYPEFLPGQAEVVQQLVGGSDAFVLMPTGGGKPLCYQVPALVREGVGVVVSPLISLMKSQVDALRQAGVRAEAFNSTMDQSERTASLRRLQEGRVDLLYVSPERLMMEGFIDVLAGLSLALFAIDEAHCISQWGHDFRPEYVELGRIKERFPEVPVGAFTATADEQTRRDVLSRLGLPHAKVFSAGFDRPNIRYQVVEKDGPSRQLRRFVQERRGQAGIVYCLSRKRTEQVATALAEAGIAVATCSVRLRLRQ